MKVPVTDGEGFAPEENDKQVNDVTSEPEETENVVEPVDEFDEEAMVEAAKRAGEAAAEADFKADAERAREEAGDLLAQLAQAQDAVDAAKKEATDATERLARLQADWDNYRKRTAAERLAERERATEGLVEKLLPVIDDLERAVSHASASENSEVVQFAEGVSAVHAKIVTVLEKEGVETIDPAGQPFNPLDHQAVGRVEDAEAYDETVAQVFLKGYRMGGKVIRPAMVSVTTGGPKRPAEEPAEGTESE